MKRTLLALLLVAGSASALELRPTVTLDDLNEYTRMPSTELPPPVGYTPLPEPTPVLEEQLHIYDMGHGEVDYRYELGPAGQPDVQYHDYSCAAGDC